MLVDQQTMRVAMATQIFGLNWFREIYYEKDSNLLPKFPMTERVYDPSTGKEFRITEYRQEDWQRWYRGITDSNELVDWVREQELFRVKTKVHITSAT